MRESALKLYHHFEKAKLGIVFSVIIIYLALAVCSGASIAELVVFWVCLAFYLVLPGLFFAAILPQIQPTKRFALPLAILYGTGFFAVLYCICMRLNLLLILRILPPVLSLLYFALLVRKQPSIKPRISIKKVLHPAPHIWMLVLLYSALLLLYTFASVTKNGLPSSVGDVLLNQDLLWNVGNANSFKVAFPPQDIRFYDVRLHYHYLTELLEGALSLVTGISAYNIVAFYMQPAMLLALVICLYAFAEIIWPQSIKKQILFCYSLFLFSCASLWKILPNGLSSFWNSNITHLITNINSQTTAIVYLCIFFGLVVAAMKKEYIVSPFYYIVMLCTAVMLCFAKGPLAAIVIISLLLTLIIGLCFKKTKLRGLIFGVLCIGIFAVIYVVMYSSGANSSMQFSFSATLEKGYFKNILQRLYIEKRNLWAVSIPIMWVVQTLLMMPAQLPLVLRGLTHDLLHFNKLDPAHMMAYGAMFGGLMGFFFFDHPAMSQVYFLFVAIFFANMLAVDNIDYLHWPSATATKQNAKKLFIMITAFFAAIGLCTTAFLYVHHMGSGARQVARNLGITEKYPYDVVVNSDDEAAMDWLRENTDTSIMFATNRIHTGARREGISNLYSALSGRQGFMEGFQYAVTNMGVSADIVGERIAVNEQLFTAKTTHETIYALCQKYEIDYIVYSTQFDGSCNALESFTLVFDSPSVKIFETGAIT